MTLTELIAHVGEKNIRIQRVDDSLRGARSVHGETHLTIATNSLSVADVMALTAGVSPPMHGLILWMPKELLPVLTPTPKNRHS